MRIRNLLNLNSKIKKSQLLLFGSLLIFIGIFIFSWNYIQKIRDLIYSDMKIAMMDIISTEDDIIENIPEVNNLPADTNNLDNNQQKDYSINYDKYLGVLEIPKIGLKRGFYNIDSKYNNIQYNVSMVKGSTLPDVVNGNLILMAHSGDAYISYFAYLYKLNVGDYAYVTYAGQKYNYQIVDIYNVLKKGVVAIRRNYDRTTLTLITCTKDSDTLQTVYIAELI